MLKTINFQVRDLDLQAKGRGGDGTEKNQYLRCPKALRTLQVEGRAALIIVYNYNIL